MPSVNQLQNNKKVKINVNKIVIKKFQIKDN